MSLELEANIYINGNIILAESLKFQDVVYVFGVACTQQLISALRQVGIQFIELVTEQAACYAAQMIGFLTQKCGVCVTRCRNLHVLGGVANAQVNAWPLLVIREAWDENHGIHSNDSYRLHCKFSARPGNASLIPQLVEKAVRLATFGQPGVSYLDISAHILASKVRRDDVVTRIPRPIGLPRVLPEPKRISQAVKILIKSERPLVVVGTSASYWRAEKELQSLSENTYMPVLTVTLGDGVISNRHSEIVNSAQNVALKRADVLILVGVKLSWLLNFRRLPLFRPNVKFIQITSNARELHPNAVGILCDVSSGLRALTGALLEQYWTLHVASVWWTELYEAYNATTVQSLALDVSAPLTYYSAFHHIQLLLPKDSILVCDIGSTMEVKFATNLPRHRLDAGIFGIMGAGTGMAIAAAFWAQHNEPLKRVICVAESSTFLLSAMEVATMVRYKLPVIVIIINDFGVCRGPKEDCGRVENNRTCVRTSPLSTSVRYDLMMKMFQCQGYFCATIPKLEDALLSALEVCITANEERMKKIETIPMSPAYHRKITRLNELRHLEAMIS